MNLPHAVQPALCLSKFGDLSPNYALVYMYSSQSALCLSKFGVKKFDYQYNHIESLNRHFAFPNLESTPHNSLSCKQLYTSLRGSRFLGPLFPRKTGLFAGSTAHNSLYYKKLAICEARFCEISCNFLYYKELSENSKFYKMSLARGIFHGFPELLPVVKELPNLLLVF